jgi:hypothetical protein
VLDFEHRTHLAIMLWFHKRWRGDITLLARSNAYGRLQSGDMVAAQALSLAGILGTSGSESAGNSGVFTLFTHVGFHVLHVLCKWCCAAQMHHDRFVTLYCVLTTQALIDYLSRHV